MRTKDFDFWGFQLPRDFDRAFPRFELVFHKFRIQTTPLLEDSCVIVETEVSERNENYTRYS